MYSSHMKQSLVESNPEHLSEIKKDLMKVKSKYFEEIPNIKRDLKPNPPYALNSFVFHFHEVLTEVLRSESYFTLNEIFEYFESIGARREVMISEIKEKEDEMLQEKDKEKFKLIKDEVEKLILEKTRLSFLQNNIMKNDILTTLIEFIGDLDELEFSGSELEQHEVTDIIHKGNQIMNKLLDFSSIASVISHGVSNIFTSFAEKLTHKKEEEPPITPDMPSTVEIPKPPEPAKPEITEPTKGITASDIERIRPLIQSKYSKDNIEKCFSIILDYSKKYDLDQIKENLIKKNWPSDMIEEIYHKLKYPEPITEDAKDEIRSQVMDNIRTHLETAMEKPKETIEPTLTKKEIEPVKDVVPEIKSVSITAKKT